ncbi:type II secretion system F family protein [Halocalculus aciditolerans]|uniref:Type II secretion protein F n=1 Tax=Halocalculus aciditolerans TaxID=1383812 RepID=A0A830FBP2_9EURY|nr:type II secretion system F family protein [Halocalculus aciditolerans]GGL59097.1 type II secretion protein F [Halocalculus aciditolerans]
MIAEFLPLAGVFALVLLVSTTPYVPRLNRLFTRIALTTFGAYTRRREPVNRHQVQTLRAAHRSETYRVFASKTFLYATFAALAGSVLSVYAVAAVVVLVVAGNAALADALPGELSALLGSISPGFSVLQLAGIFLLASATVGVAAAFAVYRFRWSMVEHDAETRGRHIDASLQRNIAFMYALSRSGMAFTDIIRVLARNKDVYGATADELEIVVKDVDMFGTDILASLRRLADRTPNDDLQEFAENLVSVLQSGQNLPSFLRDEYEYFKEQAESKQTQFLELLSTLAEAYVTVFVAGPLFLITVLVVIGLVMGGMLIYLRLLAYLVLPVTTLGFLVYLDSVTESTVATSPEERTQHQTLPDARHAETANTDADASPVTDGGDRRRKNHARLAAACRLRPITYRLRHPVENLVDNPLAVLYIVIPVAVLAVAVDLYRAATAGSLTLARADDPLVIATLFVTGTFAAAHEVRSRRISAIEAVVPDFLDRLASTNEAGMSIVESIGRVVNTELGALSRELERVWADIQWGAHAETALQRFESRMGTATVTRVTTLVTNAMGASGDLGPVLRIAADEAKASQRLKRERRTELLTYLIVIYLSFFVFIAIIVALVVVFIPSIPTDLGQLGSGAAGTSIPGGTPSFVGGSSGGGEKPEYRLLLFHTAIVQAVCSGFVAGHMGQSTTRAGAKHATLLLLVAYATLLVFGG